MVLKRFSLRRKKSELCNIHKKTPALKSLLNKVAGRKACNFIKTRLQHICFAAIIGKFLSTHFLKSICVRLILLLKTKISKTLFLNKYTNLGYFILTA